MCAHARLIIRELALTVEGPIEDHNYVKRLKNEIKRENKCDEHGEKKMKELKNLIKLCPT